MPFLLAQRALRSLRRAWDKAASQTRSDGRVQHDARSKGQPRPRP